MRRFKSLLLSLLLLLTLLLALMPYLSAEVAGTLVFLGLVAWFLFLADILVFIVSLLRRSYWRWPFSIALLFCLFCMAKYIPLHGKSKYIGTPLRLTSWNVDNFKLSKDTLSKAAALIEGSAPDVVCIQERPHTNLLAWNSVQRAFEKYKYSVRNSREDEVLNLAIFSKQPIKNIKEYYFLDSYNKIMRADITLDCGKIIRLFNVHLQTTGAGDSSNRGRSLLSVLVGNAIRRNRQADVLRREIDSSPHPVVVCGDFNDTPSSYAYRTVAGRVQDCFLKAGNGLGVSYQAMGGLFRIDYTLCSDDFGVNNYTLIRNNWSDHKIQQSEICLKQ